MVRCARERDGKQWSIVRRIGIRHGTAQRWVGTARHRAEGSYGSGHCPASPGHGPHFGHRDFADGSALLIGEAQRPCRGSDGGDVGRHLEDDRKWPRRPVLESALRHDQGCLSLPEEAGQRPICPEEEHLEVVEGGGRRCPLRGCAVILAPRILLAAVNSKSMESAAKANPKSRRSRTHAAQAACGRANPVAPKPDRCLSRRQVYAGLTRCHLTSQGVEESLNPEIVDSP
jgi:hypothetical protein